MRPPLGAGVDGLDPHARRHRVRRAVLVERLAGDAVRIALHDQRPIGQHRQDHRRHPHVMTEQVAFRQLQLGPEALAQIGDVEAMAARQVERPAAAAILDGIELIEQLPDGCLRQRRLRRAIRGFAAGRRRPRDGRLPAHLFRLHVIAQSKVRGMAELPVGSPLRELHFSEEPRFDPVGALVGARDDGKGTRLRLERLERLPDTPELRIGESGAGMTDVVQSSRSVMHAEQQRSEERPRPARFRPPGDHGRLLPHQLQLPPFRRPTA